MLTSVNYNLYYLRPKAAVAQPAKAQICPANLVSASCQRLSTHFSPQNAYYPAFTGRLTQDDIKEIQKRLVQTEIDFKNHKTELCGSIKIKNKSNQDEFLNVYKLKLGVFNHFFVRKQDKDKSLVGYTSYCKLKDPSITRDLYNTQDKGEYIEGVFMLAGVQNEYKNLGKKLHQMRIEKSITENCPGKIFIGSESIVNGVSPTGFHYKCGFVPYMDEIINDTTLPLADRVICKRDKDDENQIRKDLASKDYTALDCIRMYLPPEHFAKWKQEIQENPILDETKQLIAQGRL